jgi:nucleotide-binding universal stress UspA family protein
MPAPKPILVAFDGSDAAQAAVAAAARLFSQHRLVVTSVWEPGLAVAMATTTDTTGIGYVLPTADEMATMDRAQRDHATDAAERGARIARELGADAEAYPIPDEAKVAETLADLADQLDAEAIVVGSRGLGAFKAGLFGSTSRHLLGETRRPVLVVKAGEVVGTS